MDEKSIQFFKASLREARTLFDKETKELGELERRVYWLKDDLSKLRRTITALAMTCSEEPWADALGIRDSCVEVMTVELVTVTTAEVTRKLEAMGFDLSSQKNAAASVHKVLDRLADKGEIQKVEEDNNTIKWRGPNYDEEYEKSLEISDDDIPF